MTTDRKFSAYDRLIFAIAGNPQNLLSIARTELGHDAYDGKRGFFRYAPDELREIVELLWTQPDIHSALSKLTPAAQDYYLWINETAPRGTTSDFETADQFIDTYIADAKKLKIRQDTERQTWQLNNRIQQDSDWSLTDVANWHEQRAVEIKSLQSGKGGLKLAGEFAAESIASLDNMAHGRLDQEMMPFMLNGNMKNPVQILTGGIPLGGSMLLAGTSGVGKTRLAQNVAFSYAQYLKHTGKKSSVLLIPLEVPARFWIEGYAASRVNVNTAHGRRGLWKPDDDEYLRIRAEVEKLGKLPIASMEREQAPHALKAREHMEHMVRIFGGVTLVILDFMRLAGTYQDKKEETLRTEAIAYQYTQMVRNFQNPDGSSPCIIIVSEVKREAQPPYNQEDIKYGGTYAAERIMFIVDAYGATKIPAAVGMMARQWKRAGLEFKAVDVMPGDMLLQLTKVRVGERDLVFPGFHYQAHFTKWKLVADWEKYYRSPEENNPPAQIDLEGF